MMLIGNKMRKEVMLRSSAEATFFFKADCLQKEAYTIHNAAINFGHTNIEDTHPHAVFQIPAFT